MSAEQLERFREAQSRPGSGFEAALEELRTTGKQGHWIWYVFPQLAGLGRSEAARSYGLRDLGEAREYLQDPILGARLLTLLRAIAERLREGVSLPTLMGSRIDTLKLVSSLTLFGELAERLHAAGGDVALGSLARVAREVLAAAQAKGYPPCRHTLERLTHGDS